MNDLSLCLDDNSSVYYCIIFYVLKLLMQEHSGINVSNNL